MSTKLKLGPLPKAQPVKITILVSAELKATLDEYAALHAQSSGERNDVERLIPFMLDAFINSDRGFRSLGRRKRQSVIDVS